MNIKSMELAWIVVADIKEAKKFFTETVGLKLVEEHDQYGWLEFEGYQGGMRLGVGQYSPEYSADDKPGMNAVMSMTVDNLETAQHEMQQKGVRFIGEVMEVPGQVKMATFVDKDNNKFQLVQKLS